MRLELDIHYLGRPKGLPEAEPFPLEISDDSVPVLPGDRTLPDGIYEVLCAEMDNEVVAEFTLAGGIVGLAHTPGNPEKPAFRFVSGERLANLLDGIREFGGLADRADGRTGEPEH